jgi:hypothetical protein
MECEEADRPSHKLLCTSFARKPARPTPSHRLAIWFDTDALAPQCVWLACKTEQDEYGESVRVEYNPYLGDDSPDMEIVYITGNPLRGRILAEDFPPSRPSGYTIQTMWRDDFLKDGSRLNKAIMTTASTSGVVHHRWCGPMLAVRLCPGEVYGDIEMADLRHIVDHMVCYGNSESRELPVDGAPRTADTFRGVRVCCDGEIALHGSPAYVTVELNAGHPTRTAVRSGVISPVSKHLGMPIRLWWERLESGEEDE